MPKSKIECFFLEPTDQVEESLRRYLVVAGDSPCGASGFSYHNASVVLRRMKAPEGKENGYGSPSHPDYPHDHPSWPKACSCGYVFREEDNWQHNLTKLYRATSGPHQGEMFTRSGAPVGAMWNAGWMPPPHQGPDGLCLMLKTPGGDWCVDGKSSNGDGWTRTGEVPKITARPSIAIGKNKNGQWEYHGFLTDGYLIEC